MARETPGPPQLVGTEEDEENNSESSASVSELSSSMLASCPSASDSSEIGIGPAGRKGGGGGNNDIMQCK